MPAFAARENGLPSIPRAADLPPRADLLGSSSLFGSARHHTSLQEEESCAAAEAGTGSSGQQQAAEPQGAAQPDVAAQQLQDEASSLQPPQQDDPQQQLLNFEERQDGPQHPQHDPAQHPQQGQAPLELLQEVVRVTAANLDMSRPLRPADLLAVYHASVVPRPGQVREGS